MFKVRMSGAIDSLSTTLSFEDALEILFPAVGNSDVNGDIVDCETGEVLVIVTDGNVTHIAEHTLFEMLDRLFEIDPEAALFLALMGLIAEAFDDEPTPAPAEEEFIPRNLLEILGKL